MSISPADAIKLLQPVTRNGTRVFVRSSDNQELMDAFDSWQASCNWKPANSESRKYPKLNWSGPKYSNNWETFEQCAYVEDGNPQISCILCLNLMQHPAINGNKSMNEHVEGASHRKKVAAYKRAMDVPEGNSIMDLLAKQGRTGTKVPK